MCFTKRQTYVHVFLVAYEIIMEEFHLLCKPQCIYKIDESEMENSLLPPLKEVVAERGTDTV